MSIPFVERLVETDWGEPMWPVGSMVMSKSGYWRHYLGIGTIHRVKQYHGGGYRPYIPNEPGSKDGCFPTPDVFALMDVWE